MPNIITTQNRKNYRILSEIKKQISPNEKQKIIDDPRPY
jgi:hypothetical protein